LKILSTRKEKFWNKNEEMVGSDLLLRLGMDQQKANHAVDDDDDDDDDELHCY
jgi:hypothetical protein